MSVEGGTQQVENSSEGSASFCYTDLTGCLLKADHGGQLSLGQILRVRDSG